LSAAHVGRDLLAIATAEQVYLRPAARVRLQIRA
jgi:hypothetical protein